MPPLWDILSTVEGQLDKCVTVPSLPSNVSAIPLSLRNYDLRALDSQDVTISVTPCLDFDPCHFRALYNTASGFTVK